MPAPLHVAVVGIGAMGGGIARSLISSPSASTVAGFDASADLASSFHIDAREAGKASSDSPPRCLGEAVTAKTDAAVLVLVNENQCEDVCFGGGGKNLAGLLREGACVILCSTVSATWARSAAAKFASKGVRFVDCPVSGGPARARAGDLTMMAGGDDGSLEFAMPLLEAMGREVHVLPGGAGMGSTAKMVHQLLAGVHLACAAEALALAAKAGVDPRQIYDIVNGAAGASWMFADRGKRMIGDSEPPVMSAVDIFVKDLGIVHSEAKRATSPIPLASAALQQFVSARGLGLGRKDDSQVVRVYERFTGVPVGGRENPAPPPPSPGGGDADATSPLNVCVVGIGAMGGGIARALLDSPAVATVSGYDRAEALASDFFRDAEATGKARGDGPPDRLGAAATDATDAAILVLVNESQCERVCFGGDGDNLLSLLRPGACVVLCSTVTATWARTARGRFALRGVRFVDCPISGGPARARAGDLTMMASGDDESLTFAMPLLRAAGRDVHVIPGGAGMGSTAKMVHQLLAGVHVACAAEALSLAAKAGVDPRQMHDIVNGAAGASWMFADRGKRMIGESDPPVMSAVDIFVKDLGIVHSEAVALRCPIPLASAALQQFVCAQGLGLGRRDDSQVVRVYEQITGASVGGGTVQR